MTTDHSNIDELLNSFIDKELPQRQRTELQRLITHDRQVAERLRELQKCKMLVASLPRAQAPAEMLEDVKASLERRALLGAEPQPFDQAQGARHLLMRKVLAAAALIGLIAVFGAVIYNIVAPQSVPDKTVAVEVLERPAGQVKLEEPSPAVAAVTEKSTVETPVDARKAAGGFNARLEFKTANLIALDAVIKRAIVDNGLLDYLSPVTEGNESVYALSCSRQALALLLGDLESIWERFDSATLFVEAEKAGQQVVVDGVNAEQIIRIANQASPEKRVEVARDFAVLNTVTELWLDEEQLTAGSNGSEDVVTIPKPVLTSGEKTISKPRNAKDAAEVHLTIVVVGRK